MWVWISVWYNIKFRKTNASIQSKTSHDHFGGAPNQGSLLDAASISFSIFVPGNAIQRDPPRNPLPWLHSPFTRSSEFMSNIIKTSITTANDFKWTLREKGRPRSNLPSCRHGWMSVLGKKGVRGFEHQKEFALGAFRNSCPQDRASSRWAGANVFCCK